MFGDTRQGRAGPEGHHLLFNFTIVGGKEVDERRWRRGGGGKEVEERSWMRGGGGEEVEERRWRREEKVGERWFGSGQGSLCGR